MSSVKGTTLKIIKIMQRANKPLILNHIAKRARIAPQLVDYHLEQMIGCGIAYLVQDDDKKYYMLQPVFYDKNWMNALLGQLTPFLEDMSEPGALVLDQIEIEPEEAVIKVLGVFLKRFQEELEKMDLFQEYQRNL